MKKYYASPSEQLKKLNDDEHTYVRYHSSKGSCQKCSGNEGKVFRKNDPNKPKLPIHPNCKCRYEEFSTLKEPANLEKGINANSSRNKSNKNSLGELEQLMHDEGFRSKVYLDTKGKPTIGFGFNLGDSSNRAVLKKYLGNKYSFDRLKNGTQKMSKGDAAILMAVVVKEREKDLQKEFGEKWGKFNPETQNVLTNMAYQLGMPGFKKFRKMIAALHEEDFKTAAKEMKNSKWYREDSPNRAKRLVKRMIDSNSH